MTAGVHILGPRPHGAPTRLLRRWTVSIAGRGIRLSIGLTVWLLLGVAGWRLRWLFVRLLWLVIRVLRAVLIRHRNSWAGGA
ncbi:hypothetical protein J2853_001473 [Streptosporangium lutulentum]|uniref:Uncharacterized protein n=1 Tax=Streptosporangium lutulentum TaxID=1461250 RepID=A0ABT9Q6D5_9ACTN|nr:hypothetical protein [Streptosporangium lutulentum]